MKFIMRPFHLYVTDLYQVLINGSAMQFLVFMRRKLQFLDLCPGYKIDTECPSCSTGTGPLVISMDANFGLVRKKSAGKPAGEPHHDGVFFLPQSEVDDFVEKYDDATKKGAGVSTVKITMML